MDGTAAKEGRWWTEGACRLDQLGDEKFLVNNAFGVADIAGGLVLGYLRVRFPYRETYPHLARYSKELEERQNFKNIMPRPQNISDKVV